MQGTGSASSSLTLPRFIVGIDTNSSKKDTALQFGAHEFVNPTDLDCDIKAHLLKAEKWGYDYTFDCTGSTKVVPSHFWRPDGVLGDERCS